MNAKEKLLITGGTGMIDFAINRIIKISSKDVDLRNFNDTLKLFKK
jgi:dTDP-4-dehydrorhamnose reductase